jgi:hypothetical protein
LVQCSLCHGQGIICRVSVKKLGITCFLCDECEALWFKEDEVGTNKFEQFTVFMRSQGLKGVWAELDSVEREWKSV